jgi:hypothetical protein
LQGVLSGEESPKRTIRPLRRPSQTTRKRAEENVSSPLVAVQGSPLAQNEARNLDDQVPRFLASKRNSASRALLVLAIASRRLTRPSPLLPALVLTYTLVAGTLPVLPHPFHCTTRRASTHSLLYRQSFARTGTSSSSSSSPSPLSSRTRFSTPLHPTSSAPSTVVALSYGHPRTSTDVRPFHRHHQSFSTLRLHRRLPFLHPISFPSHRHLLRRRNTSSPPVTVTKTKQPCPSHLYPRPFAPSPPPSTAVSSSSRSAVSAVAASASRYNAGSTA